MRSSKSRSRSKNNRNRSNNSGANVVNRVFDSSGPDGKVRGTPQQIIDKYNQLARDAQLANDRVATENFQQHAEHYLRMLSEAQREVEQRREQQERENRERQAQRDRERNDQQQGGGGQQGGNGNGQNGGDQSSNGQNQQPSENAEQPRERSPRKPRFVAQDDVVDLSDGSEDRDLVVDTPENAADAAPAQKPKRARKPRAKKSDAQADQGEPKAEDETSSAAE
ncbi:DUF4167 domain-containing protein [Thalassococcus sp. BH17M4-6]|uniref:DUF4167 domain-containing protein n=1 Tax=Thalassococcus sp. BH17M4-6 TaxID=3413148 RepID=UPI003BBB39D2